MTSRHPNRWLAIAAALIMAASAFGVLAYMTYPSSVGGGGGGGIAPTAAGVESSTWAVCEDVQNCSMSLDVQEGSVLLVGIASFEEGATTSDYSIDLGAGNHGASNPSLFTSAEDDATDWGSDLVFGTQLGLGFAASYSNLNVYADTTGTGSYEYYTVTVVDVNDATMNATYETALLSGGVSRQDGDSEDVECEQDPGVANEIIIAFAANADTTDYTEVFGTDQTLLDAKTTDTEITGVDWYYEDSTTGDYEMTLTTSADTHWEAICMAIIPTAIPNAPTSLAAGTVTTTTIPLTWDVIASEEPWFISGELLQATYSGDGCGAYSDVASLSSPYDSATATGLVSGDTYCFEVEVSNETGSSPASVALTDVATTAPPSAATNLAVAPESGSTTILLVTWTPASGSILNQTVWQSTGSSCVTAGATFTNIASGTQSILSVGSLSAGTTYSFEVQEYDDGDGSAWTACVSNTTYAVPGTPSDLGTTGIASSSVGLTWVNPSGSYTLVNVTIWYGTACDALDSTYGLGKVASATTVPSLDPDTEYCFAVQVWTAGAGSDLSSTLETTTLATTPPATTNFVNTAVTGDTASFSWTNPTPASGEIINATIYYGTSTGVVVTGVAGNPGTWSHDLSLDGTPETGTVTGLSSSTRYYFNIAFWTTGGQGEQQIANVTVTTLGPVPSAPTDLTYVSASRTTVLLDWTNPDAPITNDWVVGSTNDECSGDVVATVSTDGPATSLDVDGLTAGTTYYWVVVATDSNGNSSASSCVTGATQGGTPPAPDGLRELTIGPTWVWILWANPTGYTLTDNIVYVSSAGGECGTWSDTDDLGEVTQSYNISGLTSGDTYCVEVTAVDGQSPYSLPLYIHPGSTTAVPIVLSGTDLAIFGALGVVVAIGAVFALSRKRHSARSRFVAHRA